MKFSKVFIQEKIEDKSVLIDLFPRWKYRELDKNETEEFLKRLYSGNIVLTDYCISNGNCYIKNYLLTMGEEK